ncbi:outer membrane lipoprotein carrier protein LolA [Desulfococcaceae bacterium HSG9]|nr:outer membrane lipoprotein carrier protein LolA [Desulfococcaceae bacterium HSG9]
MLRIKLFTMMLCLMIGLYPLSALSADTTPASPEMNPKLTKILKKLENRYKPTGFTARFAQESTVKALEISDLAVGNITVKRPDKMRWTYTKPENQIIITDGKTLWAHRPEENQVMVGKSPALLGDGKGASFLTDMNQIKKNFKITMTEESTASHYKLKLIPLKKTSDLAVIYILISTKTFDLTEIITYNAYQDETRIQFTDIEFKKHIDDALFTFDMPDGIDVVRFDEQ